MPVDRLLVLLTYPYAFSSVTVITRLINGGKVNSIGRWLNFNIRDGRKRRLGSIFFTCKKCIESRGVEKIPQESGNTGVEIPSCLQNASERVKTAMSDPYRELGAYFRSRRFSMNWEFGSANQ